MKRRSFLKSGILAAAAIPEIAHSTTVSDSPAEIAANLPVQQTLSSRGVAASVRVLAERDPRHEAFGAIGDGQSHPLAHFYSSLAEARRDFPQATALTDERDMCAILKMVAFGQKIYLEGYARYRWNRQAIFTSDGTFIDGDCTCTILPDMDSFNNISRAGEFTPAGCPLLFTGETSRSYLPLRNIRVGGFRIDGMGTDARRIVAVGLVNVEGPYVSHLDITGFAVGAAIKGNRVFGSSAKIAHNKIHDWYSNSTDYADIQTSQATGIDLDDGSVNNLRSDGVEICFNEIIGLTKGANTVAAYGRQTDGINIQNLAGKNHNIHHNYATGVDEGIDCFGTRCIIADNVIVDPSAAGVKLIHGANQCSVRDNEIVNAGKWALTVRALVEAGGGHVENNYFWNNRICKLQPGAYGVDIGDSKDDGAGHARQCRNNYFYGTVIDAEGGKLALHTELYYGENFFHGTAFVSPGTAGYVGGTSVGQRRISNSDVQRKTYFKAHMGKAQDVGEPRTKLQFDTTTDDRRGEWREGDECFVAQLPGLYRIGATIRSSAWQASDVVSLQVVINEKIAHQKDWSFTNIVSASLDVETSQTLAEGDIVEIHLAFDDPSSVRLNAGTPYSQFTVEML